MNGTMNSSLKVVALGLLLLMNILTAMVTVPLVFLSVQPKDDDQLKLEQLAMNRSADSNGNYPSSRSNVTSTGGKSDMINKPAKVPKELWREIEEESFQDPVVRKLLIREKDTSIEMDWKAAPPSKTNYQNRKRLSNMWKNVDGEKKLQQHKVLRNNDSDLNVNPFNFEFVIDLKGVCDRNTYLLVVVCSSVHHFDLRDSIRKTWGSFAQKLKLGVKVVFLLGSPQEEYKHLQPIISHESARYKDLVQTNFIDHYANLSLKSVAALKWCKEWCSGVQFLMKTDDDIFVNVPNLLRSLQVSRQQIQERFILGYIIENAVPIKDRYSKWYTPDTIYRNKTYPSYASGSSYVISSDLIADLYNGALKTKLFWLEDVYITGILAKEIGASLIHNDRFTYRRVKPTLCHYVRCITGHEITATEMLKVWSDIHLRASNCP